MHTTICDDHVQLAVPAASRRRLLVGLANGLPALLLVAVGLDEASARGHAKHRQHKRRRHRKQDHVPVSPPPPVPVTRADAACNASIDIAIGDPSGLARFAQTFAPNVSGALVRAELNVLKRAGESGDYVLRLCPVDGSGVPLDEVLAETSVSDSSVPEGINRARFTFAKPISVVGGTTYVLVLSRPGGNLEWAAHSGDVDCAGQGFTSQDQAAPFQGVGQDFIYSTFVSS
jgi:hypothetical protein